MKSRSIRVVEDKPDDELLTIRALFIEAVQRLGLCCLLVNQPPPS